jgi:hypothetical protein
MVFSRLRGYMEEEKGVPFGSFLKKDETYKSICDGFSERFNLLFITVLDYCHQMDLHLDLHLMQQQTEQSEELDSAQEKLLACMNYILPHVEETYQDEVQAAFDAFKDRHQNDKPACLLSEFQQLLDAFLEVVANQIKTPPPTGTTGSVFFSVVFAGKIFWLSKRYRTRSTFNHRG